MEAQTKVESKYERLRKIGIGSYGVVFKCVNRQTGQIVAIKRYSENDSDPIIRKIAMREVRMLRQLKHPNLIQLIEVFRRKRRLHLVFDYCELTVLDVIEKYAHNCPLNLIRKIIWQLVNGVSYCHAHNCIHRDIKPENILINQFGVVKLCDFGFARNLINGNSGSANIAPNSSSSSGSVAQQQIANQQQIATTLNPLESRLLGVPSSQNAPSNSRISADQRQSNRENNFDYRSSVSTATSSANDNSSQQQRQALTEYVATRWYRAPELLVGEIYYDTKIDIWAVGCVTAELMRGEPIWPGKTDLDQLQLIKGSLGQLTAAQSQSLVAQNLYDQPSIERLLHEQSPDSRLGEPLGRKLPARIGQLGAEFVVSCLQMDPARRPPSDELLQHPYIHSARMAQFVKGAPSVSVPKVKSNKSSKCVSNGRNQQSQQQHNHYNSSSSSSSFRKPTTDSNELKWIQVQQPAASGRTNSQALILAANGPAAAPPTTTISQPASKRLAVANQQIAATKSQQQHQPLAPQRKRPPLASSQTNVAAATVTQRPSQVPVAGRQVVVGGGGKQLIQPLQHPPAATSATSTSSQSTSTGDGGKLGRLTSGRAAHGNANLLRINSAYSGQRVEVNLDSVSKTTSGADKQQQQKQTTNKRRKNVIAVGGVQAPTLISGSSSSSRIHELGAPVVAGSRERRVRHRQAPLLVRPNDDDSEDLDANAHYVPKKTAAIALSPIKTQPTSSPSKQSFLPTLNLRQQQRQPPYDGKKRTGPSSFQDHH